MAGGAAGAEEALPRGSPAAARPSARPAAGSLSQRCLRSPTASPAPVVLVSFCVMRCQFVLDMRLLLRAQGYRKPCLGKAQETRRGVL